MYISILINYCRSRPHPVIVSITTFMTVEYQWATRSYTTVVQISMKKTKRLTFILSTMAPETKAALSALILDRPTCRDNSEGHLINHVQKMRNGWCIVNVRSVSNTLKCNIICSSIARSASSCIDYFTILFV